MDRDEVKKLANLEYSEKSANEVKSRAAMTAYYLKSEGWDGATYVDGVVNDEPADVEDLIVNDEKFRGHQERGVVFVLSENKSVSEAKLQELGLGDWFVVTLNDSVQMAEAFAGQRGDEGKKQALIANLAKHLATAHLFLVWLIDKCRENRAYFNRVFGMHEFVS